MLNNDKFFNQLILTSKNIQGRLALFTIGLDMKEIITLINNDIKEKHSNKKTFKGIIETEDYIIEYGNEWETGKFSAVTIDQGDVTIIFVGDENSLEINRNEPYQDISLKIELDSETGVMNIEQSESISELLDFRNLEELKNKNKVKKRKK